jgi:hypothetical protein
LKKDEWFVMCFELILGRKLFDGVSVGLQGREDQG